MFSKHKIAINRHLFYETSHSPSLADIVGNEMLSEIVDFCFIANPYYPDKKLLKLLQRQLPMLIKSYPSSNSIISQQNLASVLHVDPNSLIIGNGATELITLIIENLIEDIAIPVPTFSEYTDKIRRSDFAKLYQLPANKAYQLDLDDYSRWINDQAVTSALIINPGNPTGQLISLERMMVFLSKMSHLKMIIVDESFIDFADEQIPSLLPHINKFNNLMLVRSMSKHCGIPGLRLGYGCSSNNDFLTTLRRLLPVWNINTLAEYFLTQLQKTDAEYHKARLRVISDVRFLYQELKKIEGFEVYPTGSNFVLLKSNCGLNATELQHILLEDYHAYIRDCSNKIGLDNYHIRVASQGKKKDKLLIDALQDISRKQIKKMLG
jgi:histidinol-phosphate/aromatic aminotransferase/cobyric acid decarboxylase-like protein